MTLPFDVGGAQAYAHTLPQCSPHPPRVGRGDMEAYGGVGRHRGGVSYVFWHAEYDGCGGETSRCRHPAQAAHTWVEERGGTRSVRPGHVEGSSMRFSSSLLPPRSSPTPTHTMHHSVSTDVHFYASSLDGRASGRRCPESRPGPLTAERPCWGDKGMRAGKWVEIRRNNAVSYDQVSMVKKMHN